jgi:hypothetical protein
MQLQNIMYISLIVVVDPRYRHQAIQSILCCAYITTLLVIFITFQESKDYSKSYTEELKAVLNSNIRILLYAVRSTVPRYLLKHC